MFGPVLQAEKQFMEAAKKNDVETMKMLSRGLNFNAKNVVQHNTSRWNICDLVKIANKLACLTQYDRTALHYAVAGKNKEAVQFLLQRRIRVDQRDKVGVSVGKKLRRWC